MRAIAVGRMVAALALVGLALPPTAGAFPLTGSCTLTLTSTDARGATLDSAKSGDGSASDSDPLLVDWEGTLTWTATSTIALQNNSYHVEMFGLPTPLQGSSANTGDARSSNGTFAFKANAPIRFTGLYYISAGVRGSGGACDASLVVKLTGDPVGTIPFFVALALLAIGGLLAAWGVRGHLLGALAGGPILGFGAGLLAVVLSVLPVGGLTPAVLLVAGLVAGGAAGVAGMTRTRALHALVPAGPPDVAAPDVAAPDVAAAAVEPPVSEPQPAP